MWLFNSSVGRKAVMSITGIFLILFITFHVLMNAVAIFWPAAYNAVCGFLGANWYALVGTLVLAGGFVLHIVYAFILTVQNKRARGNNAYEVTSRPKSVEWASQNMLVLGLIVIAFTCVHLYQFWAKMMLAELAGTETALPCGMVVEPSNGAAFLMLTFKEWWVLVVYLIGFAALWFHMTHGFWSAFQSLGVNNSTWLPRIKNIACGWATVCCLLFAVEAVTFSVKANCDDCAKAYVMAPTAHEKGGCPEMKCHKGGCPDMKCDKPCDKKCDKPCDKKCDKPCEQACEGNDSTAQN
ncbi:MAG: succinate dehydrogenase cytochrome b subunit [Muribaculaceae bacterium]|nr:succinate dehydrogenase cytochrome b subunit [Muribaculaceae bacterium]